MEDYSFSAGEVHTPILKATSQSKARSNISRTLIWLVRTTLHLT